MVPVDPDLMLAQGSDKASQKDHVQAFRPGNLAIDTHAKVVVSRKGAPPAATSRKEPAPKKFAHCHSEEGWCKDG
jgi:hypothetical protein